MNVQATGIQDEAALQRATDNVLSKGGEMGTLIRSIDWSKTPVGAMECWSPALRMMVQLLLANRFPMLLSWGPELCQFYNDAYRPMLGTKHPKSMGQPSIECWAEVWHIAGPMFAAALQGGESTWSDDILLEINRHGFVEETHFTFAYSPVPDDTLPNRIGGVLATVHEISAKVVGERRASILRDLGLRASDVTTAQEACEIAVSILGQHARDIPFALLYLIDPDRKTARLAGTSGVEMGGAASPVVVHLSREADDRPIWPLAEAIHQECERVVENLSDRLSTVPPGPWADPPRSAVVLPIGSNLDHRLAGAIVLGISSRLEYNSSYRSFFELVASQVATAVARTRAHEEERKRAEALAGIYRAKMQFFSNVSHEFRTPLTLLLGPIEDALAKATLPAEQREQMELAHRNGLRLLRLVNSLLDLSRLEAGRAKAVYEPTELATLTVDLASSFRSATERGGLYLSLDCPPLPEPVYVDREMWEKVVFNLLSNAFKFTFEGGIAVGLKSAGDHVELRIGDTGTGIPEHELQHLFERFHRVEGARGRTHEGTGIGLALVKELVGLHGGSISIDSTVGQGSVFTVSLPFGKAHLPCERLGGARPPADIGVKIRIGFFWRFRLA